MTNIKVNVNKRMLNFGLLALFSFSMILFISPSLNTTNQGNSSNENTNKGNLSNYNNKGATNSNSNAKRNKEYLSLNASSYKEVLTTAQNYYVYSFANESSNMSSNAAWSTYERPAGSRTVNPIGTGRGGYYWTGGATYEPGYCDQSLCDNYGPEGFEIFNFPFVSSSTSTLVIAIQTDTPTTASWYAQVNLSVSINNQIVGNITSANAGGFEYDLLSFNTNLLTNGNNDIFITGTTNEAYSMLTQVNNVSIIASTYFSGVFSGQSSTSTLPVYSTPTFGSSQTTTTSTTAGSNSNNYFVYSFANENSSLTTHAGWSSYNRGGVMSYYPIGQGRGGWYWSGGSVYEPGYCSESLCNNYGPEGFEIFDFPYVASSTGTLVMAIQTNTPNTQSWYAQVSLNVTVNSQQIGTITSASIGGFEYDLLSFNANLLTNGNNDIFITGSTNEQYDMLTQVHNVTIMSSNYFNSPFSGQSIAYNLPTTTSPYFSMSSQSTSTSAPSSNSDSYYIYSFANEQSSMSSHAAWSTYERTTQRTVDPIGTGRGGFYWTGGKTYEPGYCDESLCNNYGPEGFEIFDFPYVSSSTGTLVIAIQTDTPNTQSWYSQVSLSVSINNQVIGSITSASIGNSEYDLLSFNSNLLKNGNNDIFIDGTANELTSMLTQVNNVTILSSSYFSIAINGQISTNSLPIQGSNSSSTTSTLLTATPGFETILMIASLCIVYFYRRRK